MSVEPGSGLMIAYADHTLTTTTITGTGWDATDSEANVAVTRYTKLALATTNNCSISMDLTRAKAIDIVTMPRHTLTESATWRVRLSNNVLILTNPNGTPVGDILYDSGAVGVWPDISEFTNLPYNEYTGWAESLENLFNPPALLFLPKNSSSRYLHIEFSDPDSTSYTISKITISPVWRPTNGVSAGWSTKYVSPSKPIRTKGGFVSIEARARYRQLSFTCANLPEHEALSHVPILDRDYAGSNPFAVLIDPSDVVNRNRLFIYGTNTALTPITGKVHKYYSKKFTIDEWL